MKNATALVITCLLACYNAASQTFISAQSMATETRLTSSLYFRDANSWFVLREVKGQQNAEIGVLENWKIRTPSNSRSLIPYADFSLSATTISGAVAWIGSEGSINYSDDLINWKDIPLREQGRELVAYALAPAENMGILASISSYVVTQSDTNNGIVYKRVTDIKNRLEYITPESRRVLYQDTGRRDPFTIGVRTIKGGYAVGFGRSGLDDYYMAFVDPDIQVRLVAAPSDMPSGVSPSHLHRADNGDIYCFYGASSMAGRLRPPFCVVYHELSGLTEYIQLPSGIGPVRSAINFAGRVICASDGGILTIRDRELRWLQPTDGQSNVAISILGFSTIGTDTLLAVAREGIVVYPASYFSTTSVAEPNPGRLVTGDNSVELDHFFSGHDEVEWRMYDDGGRLISQGTTEIGQTDLKVPMGSMTSGSYSVMLTTGSNTVLVQRLLYMK